MTDHQFDNIQACVFDAYGTLFDVHAPVSRVAAKIGDAAETVSQLWRQKQLEYTWLRSLMGAHVDFWTVTGEALDYTLLRHGIHNATLYDKLMELYRTLDAYEDARAALQTLQAAGFKTAILSNGSPDMLGNAVSSAGIGHLLDDVISIEDAGIYKPNPRVYQLAVDRCGVDAPERICFVSANTWDAQAAAHFGFRVARIDRFGLPDEKLPGKPLALVKSLSEVADLVTGQSVS